MNVVRWYHKTCLARNLIFWAIAIICVFGFVSFVVWQQEGSSNSNAATLPYNDDGQGLVLISGHSEDSVYKAIQVWRNDHPDRFNRHVGITINTHWSGVIISYKP